MTEFPVQPVTKEEAGNVPSVVLEGGASGQATTVKVSQIETELEYHEAGRLDDAVRERRGGVGGTIHQLDGRVGDRAV